MKNIFPFLLIFVLTLLVNITFSQFDFSLDLTEDKKYSISKESKQILNNLDDVIYIKVYLDGAFPYEFKYLQDELFTLLSSFKNIANKNFDFEFIDPNKSNDLIEKENLFKQLVKDGLKPTDIEFKSSSVRTSQIIFPGAIVYYKGRSKAVNFLKSQISKKPSENINLSVENLEFEFISSIYRLHNERKDKIAFLEGNGELNEAQVYDLTESVYKDDNRLSYHYIIERFNLKEFHIDSLSGNADINQQIKNLSEYKVIIIAKPTIAFNMLDKYIIDQYVMNGGKIIWFIDGVNANMDSLQSNNSFIATRHNLNIDDLLFKYGLRVNSDLIEDIRSTQIPIISGYSNNVPQQTFFPWPYFPLISSKSSHPVTKGLDALKCNFASSIDTIQNSIKKTILLTSSKHSRILPTPAKVSLGILESPPPINTYNKSYLPISVLLEGSFESVFKNRITPLNQSLKFKKYSDTTKMIVVSDGDVLKNRVTKSGDVYPLGYDPFIKYTYPGNKKFLLNSIHYLCDDQILARLKPKSLKLRLLDVQKVNEYRSLIQILNIFLPIIFLTVFSVLFLLLKRKKYA
jgi:gliding-associated putative ABC transporter substrate-binding component GldG